MGWCPSHHHLPRERQVLTIFVIPQVEKPVSQKEPTTPYTVKLRGAPFNVTEVWIRKGRVGRPGSDEVRSWKELGSGLQTREGDQWQCEECFRCLPWVPGWRLAVKKGGGMGLDSSVVRSTLAALTENPGPVPSIHNGQLIAACNFQLHGVTPSTGHCGYLNPYVVLSTST